MQAEISYDLVMSEDMSFVEGCYRLPGEAWQVVIASKEDVTALVLVAQVWESGVRGMVLRFPRDWPLHSALIERTLGEACGVYEWVVVQGPDSLQLR